MSQVSALEALAKVAKEEEAAALTLEKGYAGQMRGLSESNRCLRQRRRRGRGGGDARHIS